MDEELPNLGQGPGTFGSRKISKITFGLISWGQTSNVESLKQQMFDICVLVESGFLCHFEYLCLSKFLVIAITHVCALT